MDSNLWASIAENTLFAAQFLGIAVFIFAVAVIAEKLIARREGSVKNQRFFTFYLSSFASKLAKCMGIKMSEGTGGTGLAGNGKRSRILTTRKIAVIGVFSAMATVLYIFDFPLPFIPSFYKLDFSELPALVGTFAYGPVAGVMIEFCKIILKLLTKGTTTAFVGDLANFMIGCSYILPASIIYALRKSKKSALIGCAVGTGTIAAFGTLLNAVYLIPMFAQLFFGGGEEAVQQIVDMGSAVNPAIDNVMTLAVFAAGPLNLIKGVVASLVTLLIYKKLSPILKEGFKLGN
ncbi:MAG: ECF transporter S component [Lachnospiraceae bacterium]|jgi:riboflavin transporter FmnP|nr:ECF transporter S component [Lachnospiraceae bacterium]